jgi:hypothetical protein
MSGNPFDPTQEAAYQQWREQKLAGYPARLEELIVEVSDPRSLSSAEHARVLQLCRKANMALYASPLGPEPDKEAPRALGRQFGLERLDGNLGADEDAITSLTVQSDALHRGYIPYSNRPIAWHTDGYYNPPQRQIHGLLLHCVQPAEEGGENDLLDHEIAYLLLRDRSPDCIRALMSPDAMTIPANFSEGQEIRQRQPGPVFSIRPDGRLHMRYTARTRSIEWRDDPLTREAVACLEQILRDPCPWRFRGKLQSGQGLICNNVLHTRTGFRDGPRPRLLYRARYYDRIRDT